MCVCLPLCKIPIMLVRNQQNMKILYFFVKFSNIILLVGDELFDADGRTDGQPSRI